jgi:bifunctional non-homologous end joining protein LigD
MLATLADAPLQDRNLVYEPKYDGIRAIVLVEPDASGVRVRFWSRNGNEKTAQFPEIARALQVWGGGLEAPVVLDGEIVALDANMRPTGFQRLQNRIHVKAPGYSSSKPILRPDEQPTALIAFDLLREGDDDLRKQPLIERRQRLDALFERVPSKSTHIRKSEIAVGDGRGLQQRAVDEGWEGLIVKHARSPYRDGKRSTEWRKLKILNQGEFVIGGYTEPKGMRSRFGALILGVFDTAGRSRARKELRYAGDVGTGFSGKELDRLWKLLEPLRTSKSPFETPPKTLGKPHWVKPVLVAQVQFAEWTDEGRLRHPAYLGLRDDKPAVEVTREMKARTTQAAKVNDKALKAWQPSLDALVAQLDDLENRRKNGKLQLPDGDRLEVTNLHKLFWPGQKFTKGDLLRYYARVAPLILPVIDDRPLIMKRLPNGVDGQAFYQHRAPEPVPPGIRVETLPDDDVPARLIGGSLKTLLYMAQLASISMDPWFSTMADLDHADQVAIDLDPQPGATFAQILDVARWVREELERLDVPAYPKTSGSEGLHIFIPLPPDTSYEAGMLFCQIVATMVASKHPKVATVERTVGKRKAGTVYVDYLQNIQGKTLACAYSARASAFAGVSTPLTWEEVDDSPAPQDFTIANFMDRAQTVGDLWAGLRSKKRADLMGALEKLQR